MAKASKMVDITDQVTELQDQMKELSNSMEERLEAIDVAIQDLHADRQRQHIDAMGKASPPKPGWLPIDTAPDDYRLHWRGIWDNEGNWARVLGYDLDDGYFYTTGGYACGRMAKEFTHWYPCDLPPPPEREE